MISGSLGTFGKLNSRSFTKAGNTYSFRPEPNDGKIPTSNMCSLRLVRDWLMVNEAINSLSGPFYEILALGRSCSV